jgi:hypothetical protein
MLSQRDFSNAPTQKCHPEPAAKDLAAALFAAAIRLVLVALRAPVFETANNQANRSARNAPSEILRFAQDDTAFRPALLSL